MRWSLVIAIGLGWLVTRAAAGGEPTGGEGSTGGGPSFGILVGFGDADITPPIGYRVAGNYHESISRGIDDPLMARAMYVSDGASKHGDAVLVVSLDVCSIGRDVHDTLRRRIVERTGMKFSHIMISATHNHAGPEYYGVMRDHHHDVAQKRFGTDPHERVNYVELLATRVSAAASRARASAIPARVRCGDIRVPGIAFNRRFHMLDGTVRFNPGFANPDIIRAAGPVDDRMTVLWFDDVHGQPLGCHVTFPMHTATYGDLTRFGADFPGVLEDRLREKYGKRFVCLFGEGTAGDINHLDFQNGQPPDQWSEASRIGRRMASELETNFETLATLENARLRFNESFVSLPLIRPDREKLQHAPELLFRPTAVPFLDRVAAWQTLNTERYRSRFGDELPTRIFAFSIGPRYAMVMMPHEIFVELGMAIRSRSPFPVTSVVTLAGDMDFYIATERAYAEGSYEITTSSVRPGSGEGLVDAAVQSLRTLVDDRPRPE